jgi:nicotinate-nucleotide pyrophosphorylase (carboxylating)
MPEPEAGPRREELSHRREEWDAEELAALVRRALAEDVGPGDLTAQAVVAPETRGCGLIRAKEAGVISGLAPARAVFHRVDPSLAFDARVFDGEAVSPGAPVAAVRGAARSILSAERTALNFLQHLSGVATRTARLVEEVAGSGVRILDTRKTIPGLRHLEKEAVRHGGGMNHRLGLYDAVMIKENHIAAAGSLEAALAGLDEIPPGVPVVVEVRTLDELRGAVASPADQLLLDNFTPDEVRAAVDIVRRERETRGRKIAVEVSGGITLANVKSYALPGVDFISVGGLTHSAPALDIALDLTLERA